MNILYLVVPLLITIAVFLIFIALQRWMNQESEVTRRLTATFGDDDVELRRRKALSAQVNAKLGGLSMASGLDRQLASADLKLSAAEFLLIRFGLTALLFLLGWLISRNLLGGLLLSGFGWMAPGLYLKQAQTKRAADFATQLPDMLNLLVGSLRAGYGLLHACNVVKDEMPNPIGAEFARVIKEVSLGFSVTTALDHMVDRLKDEDLSLIVTAIHIQNEVGGSLADVLESTAATIRERIKLKGQIRVMTSQQRATGWVLTALPFAAGTFLMLLNPDYMMEMFQPGWPMLIPLSATVMVILGNMTMRMVMKVEF